VCGIFLITSYLTIYSGKKTIQESYREALEAPTREEFLEKVKGSDPKNFVLHYEHLEYFVDKHYAPKHPEFTPQFTEFTRVPVECRDWVVTELPSRDRPKTLVLWGPSRTGKTSWARSLGNHTYLGNAWSVKMIKETSDYIVIDDIDISNFRLWQPFLGKSQILYEKRNHTYLVSRGTKRICGH
jgi:hypothetical protein